MEPFCTLCPGVGTLREAEAFCTLLPHFPDHSCPPSLAGRRKGRMKSQAMSYKCAEEEAEKSRNWKLPNLLLEFLYSFFKWAKPSNSKEQKQAHFFELAASEGPIHLGVVSSQLFKKCFPNLHTDHLRSKSTSSSLRTRKGRALFTEMGLFRPAGQLQRTPLYSVPSSTYPTIFYSSITSKGSKRAGKTPTTNS